MLMVFLECFRAEPETRASLQATWEVIPEERRVRQGGEKASMRGGYLSLGRGLILSRPVGSRHLSELSAKGHSLEHFSTGSHCLLVEDYLGLFTVLCFSNAGRVE